MIKIAFIIDKGFMQSLIEKCRKQLLSDLNCSIETIQWNHELRKSFPKAKEYNFVINFTTHTLFKKDYPHENLIQIPFISNLRSGISRELYQSIITCKTKRLGINIHRQRRKCWKACRCRCI